MPFKGSTATWSRGSHWLGDDVGRERLHDRIRRIQARIIATDTEQFPDQQQQTIAVRNVLLNEWAGMLEALRPANDAH